MLTRSVVFLLNAGNRTEGVAGSGELTGGGWLRLGRGGGMEREQNGSGKRWRSSSAHSRATATSDGTGASSPAAGAYG